MFWRRRGAQAYLRRSQEGWAADPTLGGAMTDTRISISLAIAFVIVALAALLAIQPYSVRSPWSAYDVPGRRFLSAALNRDSAALRVVSASPAAVDWALHTRRDHPSALSVWAHFARAGTGVVASDTSTVLFETATAVCPVIIRFLGHDERARVLEAEARCYSNRRDVF
jgi:hypothetical protein